MEQRYSNYRSSGVEWIGEIPSHWDAASLKRFCKIQRGSSPRPIDNPKYFDDFGEFSWVRISDVSKSDRYLIETESKLSVLGSNLSTKIEPNDIFLSIAGSVGKPIITKIKCCIHDGFVWFQNLKIDKEFLYYIFKSGQCFIGLGKMGTQLNLNTDTVGMICIPIPPLPEQEQIVKYLDKKTSQIDNLISTTEKKIELLKQKRTSLINEVVTKGLNRDVEMKDSGVEWIGEIPKHWTAEKVGHHISILSGFPFKSELFDSIEGFPILRIRDITSGKCETFYKGEYNKEHIVSNNDLLIGMDGDFTLRWWDGGDVLLNQRCCSINTNSTLKKRFLYYTLPDKLKLVNDLTYYTTVKHLSNDDIRGIKISIPPLPEQEQIVKYLDEKTSQIDNLVSIEQRRIDTLKEYRQSLISEVVSGKIKVTIE